MSKRIFNFFIVIFPILSTYKGIAGIDLGTVILFIIGFICLIFNLGEFKLKLPRGFGLFYILALIFSFIFTQSFPLRLSLFTINLILACNYLDIEKILDYYFKTVTICCIFFLVQEISYFSIGVRVPGILPFLPTIYEGIDNTLFIQQKSLSDRSSSFFLEPSYFAQFLFPYIAYNLFSNNNKDIKRAVYVSIIMILIRSGNGIILLIIIWGSWILFSKIKPLKKIGIITLGIIGFFIISINNSTIFTSLLERSNELKSYQGNETHMSSGFIRFFRGYHLYSELPTINQLFGSDNEMIAYRKHINIFFKDGDSFFNGIQTLLLHNGLFVCIAYLIHLVLLSKRKADIKSKVIVICMLYLMAGESYYLTSRIFFITVFMYGLYFNEGIRKFSNNRNTIYLK